MVNWNWSLLVELVYLAQEAGNQELYLDLLLEMEVSVKLVEVIFGLAHRIQLAPSFINALISKTIKGCGANDDIAIQVSYQTMSGNSNLIILLQNRILKAFCALVELFLQQCPEKLLSQFAEILSFCVSYSHIPDCTLLYKHLKDFEGNIDF